jgi:hypothetical protein
MPAISQYASDSEHQKAGHARSARIAMNRCYQKVADETSALLGSPGRQERMLSELCAMLNRL